MDEEWFNIAKAVQKYHENFKTKKEFKDDKLCVYCKNITSLDVILCKKCDRKFMSIHNLDHNIFWKKLPAHNLFTEFMQDIKENGVLERIIMIELKGEKKEND